MLGKLGILLLVVAATIALPSPRGAFELLRSPSNDIKNTHGRGHILHATPMDYETGRRYCWGFSHDFSELETKEEEDWVLNWIYRSVKDVDFVWVAGKWDGNSSYIWESELPLRNDTAWLPGEPSERNEDSRVAIMRTENGMGLITRPKTEKYATLCEFI